MLASIEEVQTDNPAAIVLLMSHFGDSLVPGYFCTMLATHEIYFCGRGTISIWNGEKEGLRDVSIDMSWASVQ